MRTEIIRLDAEHPDAEVLHRAGEKIRQGELVAFPTETVYGLGGDALSPDAARKIYAAKGRPSDNPLIVHIADMEAMERIAGKIPDAAGKLAVAFWPGPLTMILKKTDAVPYETSGGLDTVAVRMPMGAIPSGLIRASGGYIAAPSANASGRPSPTNASDVAEDMDGRIAMILDGGSTDIGLESTIVDLTEEVPVVLRPGFISREMLREVLGEVRLDPGITDAGAHEGIRPKAPGMRYRHYAPKAPLFIVEGEESRVLSRIAFLAEEACRDGKRVGIIAAEESAPLYAGTVRTGRLIIKPMGSRKEDIRTAQRLFSVLRDFDREAVDVIYSESFDTPRLGMAIMNRLLKAAGHQVIEV